MDLALHPINLPVSLANASETLIGLCREEFLSTPFCNGSGWRGRQEAALAAGEGATILTGNRNSSLGSSNHKTTST
jgi:hypothetical protein